MKKDNFKEPLQHQLLFSRKQHLHYKNMVFRDNLYAMAQGPGERKT